MTLEVQPGPATGRRVIMVQPTTGTRDDDDDPGAEQDDENEPPVRETNERTEAPEEFETDDQDGLPHPEDEDADDDEA